MHLWDLSLSEQIAVHYRVTCQNLDVWLWSSEFVLAGGDSSHDRGDLIKDQTLNLHYHGKICVFRGFNIFNLAYQQVSQVLLTKPPYRDLVLAPEGGKNQNIASFPHNSFIEIAREFVGFCHVATLSIMALRHADSKLGASQSSISHRQACVCEFNFASAYCSK